MLLHVSISYFLVLKECLDYGQSTVPSIAVSSLCVSR
jgi:hypothetical protein